MKTRWLINLELDVQLRDQLVAPLHFNGQNSTLIAK